MRGLHGMPSDEDDELQEDTKYPEIVLNAEQIRSMPAMDLIRASLDPEEELERERNRIRYLTDRDLPL